MEPEDKPGLKPWQECVCAPICCPTPQPSPWMWAVGAQLLGQVAAASQDAREQVAGVKSTYTQSFWHGIRALTAIQKPTSSSFQIWRVIFTVHSQFKLYLCLDAQLNKNHYLEKFFFFKFERFPIPGFIMGTQCKFPRWWQGSKFWTNPDSPPECALAGRWTWNRKQGSDSGTLMRYTDTPTAS